jgi:hypothetical protein
LRHPYVPISRTDQVSGESGSVPENSSGQPTSTGALLWSLSSRNGGASIACQRLALRKFIPPFFQQSQWDIPANLLKI